MNPAVPVTMPDVLEGLLLEVTVEPAASVMEASSWIRLKRRAA
jgi:hypothetical protein